MSSIMQTQIDVLTLNVGGRNTNIYEFDMSAKETPLGKLWLQRRNYGMEFLATVGPSQLLKNLDSGFADALQNIQSKFGEKEVVTCGSAWFNTMLQESETWYGFLKALNDNVPRATTTLNILTLSNGRPSPLEAPENCVLEESTPNTLHEFIDVWQLWLEKIDTGKWVSIANSKDLSLYTCVASMFVFDVMSFNVVLAMFNDVEDSKYLARHLEFSMQFAFFSASGKYKKLADVLKSSNWPDVVCLQEAGSLAMDESQLAHFPNELKTCIEMINNSYYVFPSSGKETMLLLNKDTYGMKNTCSHELMSMDSFKNCIASRKTSDNKKQISQWMSNLEKFVAVTVHYENGKSYVFSAGHCSASNDTADYMALLKCEMQNAAPHSKLFVLGVDSNCTSKERTHFLEELYKMQMLSTSEKFDETDVTVSKKRTPMQAQVSKTFVHDASLKDFVLAWDHADAAGEHQLMLPILNSDVDLLPTDEWPFDHSAVWRTINIKH